MSALLGLGLLVASVCSDTSDCATDVQLASGMPDWPVGGALGARLYCIEGYESRHAAGAYNPRSGAAGWLQWLPGTARRWGVAVGDRASEWSAAARIAAQGEAFFRSQWVPLQLGLC